MKSKEFSELDKKIDKLSNDAAEVSGKLMHRIEKLEDKPSQELLNAIKELHELEEALVEINKVTGKAGAECVLIADRVRWVITDRDQWKDNYHKSERLREEMGSECDELKDMDEKLSLLVIETQEDRDEWKAKFEALEEEHKHSGYRDYWTQQLTTVVAECKHLKQQLVKINKLSAEEA